MYDVKLLKLPQISLGLVWVAYILLGWYLSAYHVVWLVGVLVAMLTIAAAWQTNPLVDLLLKLFGSQSLFVVISLSLMFSLAMALVTAEPALITLFAAPVVTMLLAALDLQAAGVRQLSSFAWLIGVAVIGLGLGEGIDLLLLPSMRY